MTSVINRDGARKADLAAIHIAKKELGWDDDLYHDVLRTVCRVESSAALDFTGRKRWLEHLRTCLKACGRPGAAAKARPVRTPLTPVQRKMWALWQQLADAGLVQNRKMPALVAYAHRQTGVDKLEWLSGAQEDLVIVSMKAWLKRGGAEAA